MQTSLYSSSELLRALSDCNQQDAAPSAPTWQQRAEDAFLTMDESCSACHVAYRN